MAGLVSPSPPHVRQFASARSSFDVRCAARWARRVVLEPPGAARSSCPACGAATGSPAPATSPGATAAGDRVSRPLMAAPRTSPPRPQAGAWTHRPWPECPPAPPGAGRPTPRSPGRVPDRWGSGASRGRNRAGCCRICCRAILKLAVFQRVFRLVQVRLCPLDRFARRGRRRLQAIRQITPRAVLQSPPWRLRCHTPRRARS